MNHGRFRELAQKALEDTTPIEHDQNLERPLGLWLADLEDAIRDEMTDEELSDEDEDLDDESEDDEDFYEDD